MLWAISYRNENPETAALYSGGRQARRSIAPKTIAIGSDSDGYVLIGFVMPDGQRVDYRLLPATSERMRGELVGAEKQARSMLSDAPKH